MKNLRKKFVLMSQKISVDHLAFVTGAKDLLVVKLLKGWTPKTEVSDLVHHHHQHHHHHLCSLVWQQKHKKKLKNCSHVPENFCYESPGQGTCW